MHRLNVHIKGIVQGVGFRPYVHALAHRYNIKGWVINDSRGVEIEVDSADSEILHRFYDAVISEAPPLAQIVQASREYSEVGDSEAHKTFEIRKSAPVEGERVLISPDVAVCTDCLREMYDPSNRRYRYPFLNCTNCGPRFTIIQDVPYDRPMTTMGSFPMCADCESEYREPSDRRFHAQPTCCEDCGPEFQYLDADGKSVLGDPIDLTIQALHDGKTVAIKGIGGFHLACDAFNDKAVRRLRKNKHREAKPLAVMVGGISAAKRLAEISDDAEKVLMSSARPIVICPERDDSNLPQGIIEGIWGVTGGVKTVGIMLPYAPLHHLLFRPLPIGTSGPSKIILPEEIGGPGDAGSDAFRALVMTSGNLSDEPIAIDNLDAVNRLKGIADGFLVHNRDIYRRCDDSVLAVRPPWKPQVWRLGRGYAPRPVYLTESLPRVLGVGPEMKNTVCHIRDDKAFISPHVGDLKTFEAYEYFKETIAHQERILGVQPIAVACDLHPDYLSTRWAEESGLPLIKIQHHYAHVVALMAEHGLLKDKVLGLAMDGTGLGDDNAIWGGEILLCDALGYERIGQIDYAPLPGGDAAVKEIWRSALGRLWTAGEGLPDEFRPLFKDIASDRLDGVERMIRADVNCPKVDSLGRLFDAAAFVAGLMVDAQYDGQAPMLLEAACGNSFDPERELLGIIEKNPLRIEGREITIEGSTIIQEMATKRLNGESTRDLARWFHLVVIEQLAYATIIAAEIAGTDIIGFTGGCFMNRILEIGLMKKLERDFRILRHEFTPPNDGCISLGQAVAGGLKVRDTADL